jgi:isoleucyl-tRNA synthetase
MSANYKDTLLLPKTDFPMKADLVKREPERLAKWEAAGIYQQTLDARKEAPLFVLHDGPPFANGDVHMGTALNKILKDLIVKSRHMLGFRAPFVPGWDCHGLPIEFKVVKESRGLAPAEIRRRAEEFARKYIDIQRGQFKRLGVFGSWSEPYLTLEPGYEAEIIRAFGTFVDKGLVYQSKKPVYWSTGAQTALAEAEVEYAQRTDPAIYVRFKVSGATESFHGHQHIPNSHAWVKRLIDENAYFVVWTTTPWTLPANVAIAVNPLENYVRRFYRDAQGEQMSLFVAESLVENFESSTGLQPVFVDPTHVDSVLGRTLAGLEAQHPFLERKSRVITADFVTMDTGTGQVHIAPGHGKDDYIAGQQNKLPVLSPVDDYGKFTDDVGMPEWTGKYVFDANTEVVAHLRTNGSLLAEQKYTHDYPHCWRSKTPIVFRAVEQFFIKVEDIRADALKAIDETQWIPAWGRNRIYGTVESRPDWCISRQRTWGVPLPVFYDEKGTPIVLGDLARKVADLVEKGGTNLWFEKDDAWWANELGLPAGTSRRNDTLDVWIDSGVSHQAVTKKHPELAATGGVADVYLEATDQHRGWFQSSLMTSVAITGHAPYKTVITHGFVVDKDTKKKISKSAQGTYQKPMDAAFFVNKYGADIVRLWAASVNFTDDVPFSEESFTRISEAYRGFRNVLRILLANLHDFESGKQESRNGATIVDRWILSKLQTVIATCRAAYEAYDFRGVFETLNQFCTVELSALYVDITKDRMYCDAANSPRRRATQTVMSACVDAATKLLAPILAFTADEAWEFARRPGSVHVESFPQADESLRDAALEAKVDEWLKLRGIIYQQAIEPARAAKTIAKSLESSVTLALPETQHAALAADQAELEEFFIVSELTLASAAEPAATVIRSGQPQCPRCWRHQPLTARGLCERCSDAVPA